MYTFRPETLQPLNDLEEIYRIFEMTFEEDIRKTRTWTTLRFALSSVGGGERGGGHSLAVEDVPPPPPQAGLWWRVARTLEIDDVLRK